MDADKERMKVGWVEERNPTIRVEDVCEVSVDVSLGDFYSHTIFKRFSELLLFSPRVTNLNEPQRRKGHEERGE
jgi:hypothetical protein